MYFPNAFKKVFMPASTTLRTTGSTADLTAGQIGFFNSKTFAAQASGTATPFILAQGSYFTSDKIGPVHGGYKESVKSKEINPKYISRVIKIGAKTAQNQVVTVSISKVYENNTYRLRVDLKGSPALRFLSHNFYKTLDAFTGCEAVSGTSALVDPTTVAIKWAKQIDEHPFMTQFVSSAVKDTADATVAKGSYDTFTPAGSITTSSTAKLVLTVAYLDTKFGNCTFTPTDFYELQPLQIYTSFVEESGDPCTVNGFSSVETTAPRQASGLGESVVRDLILDGRYRQEAFPDSSRVESLRMREIEGNPKVMEMLSVANRNALYDQVMILHSVPRFYNPTGTFDNDQYLLVINVPTGTSTTTITDFVVAAATAAGNSIPVNAAGVTFEAY